jgi:hypothetical protein
MPALALLLVACSSETPTPSSPQPGHDAGDPCANGACQDGPRPTDDAAQPEAPPSNVLVSDPEGQGARDLQLVAGYLYWRGGTDRIVRAPTTGGGAKTLFTHAQGSSIVNQIWGLVVDEASIYFTDDGNMGQRGLYKMPSDGSMPPAIVAEGRAPYAIAADADDVCFVDGDAIRCSKKSDGTTTTVARGVASYMTNLAVDHGFVYFQAALESMADEVYRLPVTAVAPDPDAGSDAGGPAPEKVSIVPGRYVIGLSSHVENGFIYWGTLDRVYRASATSPATEVIPAASDTSSSSPDALYAFGNAVYWIDTFPPGSVTQLSLLDGSRMPLYAAGGATSLAVDDQYLYAANESDILKLPR